MKNDEEILVVRCNIVVNQEILEDLRLKIAEQRDTGVIMLPYFCDALIIPKDLVIKMMNLKGDIVDVGQKV